jgi:hypothetical protein
VAIAPETGFYFEPLTERLVLLLGGAAFPTDDHWAWIGDPIEITQEQARLECALRWPGVDPDSLEVEFDLDFEKAAVEAERQRAQVMAGIERAPREFDLDVDQLLAQADLLREAARQLTHHQATPEALERAAEEEQMIRDLARGLVSPGGRGRDIARAAPQAAAPSPAEEQASEPARDGAAARDDRAKPG